MEPTEARAPRGAPRMAKSVVQPCRRHGKPCWRCVRTTRSATMRFIASKRSWTGSKWPMEEEERNSPALIAGPTNRIAMSGLGLGAAALGRVRVVQIGFHLRRLDQVVVVLVDRLPVAHFHFPGLRAVLHLALRGRTALAGPSLSLVGRLRCR